MQPQLRQARSSPHPSALLRPWLQPSERVLARSVPSNRLQAPLEAVLTERNGQGRAQTVANRAGTALTGAVRTGLITLARQLQRRRGRRRRGTSDKVRSEAVSRPLTTTEPLGCAGELLPSRDRSYRHL